MFQKSHRPQQKTGPQKSEKQVTRRFQIVKLEERIAPDCKFNPNAGPWTRLGYYGGKFKYGKYVGQC